LDSRVLVRQETQTEVTWFFAVQREPVHTLCRVGCDKVLQEEI
jgi:hypothetical protein